MRWVESMAKRTARASGIASLAVLVCSSPGVATAGATPAEDAYLRGYAAAVLEQSFGVQASSLAVADGVIRVRAADLGAADRARVRAALGRIRGAAGVEIDEQTAAAPLARETTPARVTMASAAPLSAAGSTPAAADSEALKPGFLPRGYLFDALLADPRWPHFSASFQRYVRDRDFRDVASVSFGETIPIYRDDLPFGGQWEAGLQAGVFAIFDMNAQSHDLVNADYFAAAMGAYRIGDFQALARVFHESSHLGDEFLLRTRVNRVNLSYEAVDGKVSYHFFDHLVRLYGGGGYLFDRDPSRIKPWFAQEGVEVRKRFSFLPWATPVAAVDIQEHQQNGWSPDISLRAGLQFDRARILGRRLLLTFEYFNGHSPNGQFYKQAIDYLGIGAHFHYGGGGE